MKRKIVLATALLLGSAAGWADGLRVENAWIRLLPGKLPAGGYFIIHNETAKAVDLVAIESSVYTQAMLHESIEKNGSATMQHVPAVTVPARGRVRFKPGGYHVMLMNPKLALKPGTRVPAVLSIGDGRQVNFEFITRDATGK